MKNSSEGCEVVTCPHCGYINKNNKAVCNNCLSSFDNVGFLKKNTDETNIITNESDKDFKGELYTFDELNKSNIAIPFYINS